MTGGVGTLATEAYDEDACSICGGDAWVECDDPIQCCATHNGDPFDGGEHHCPACRGSGRASKQVIW